jgi:chemotaxis protein methyltransferase CheR
MPLDLVPRPASANATYPFTAADFDRVRGLIFERAGIKLNDSKQNMVYSRLARRLRALELPSFGEYLDRLERSGGGEWQEFVNALTTNLTSFYREEHHFPMLAEHVRRAGPAPAIWCAAASTGEEPYSIAMTVADAAGPGARARILATDIDTNVLATARQGVYPLEAVKPVPAEQLRRHFLRGTGPNEGRVRARPALAAMIDFRPLNLLAPRWDVGGPFDVIFCRNVMIYFDKPTQRAILDRMAAEIKPGGMLFIGHSENITDRRDLFKLRGKTAYERLGGPGAPA